MGRASRASHDATTAPSARTRAVLLEYAADLLLPAGSSGESLAGVLDRLVADFGAEAALAVAPGAPQPPVEYAADPHHLLTDPALLAGIRAACAAGGGGVAARGRMFETTLDADARRVGVLVAYAGAGDDQVPCALVLAGNPARWNAGARSTLRAIATMAAALLRRNPPRRRDLAAPAGRESVAKALVSGSPDAIVAIDSDLRIREFNAAAEEMFGWPRADVLGRNMPDTLVPEDSRQEVADGMSAYLATGDRSSLVRQFDIPALRSDGTERLVSLTPMAVEVADETFFFGFLHDSTELENALCATAEGEARFRLLSALAPVGIIQTDVDGVCTFVNDRWSELTEIAASETAGMTWRQTIHPEDVAMIEATRERNGDGPELAVDCRLRTASGREMWVHVVVQPVLDQHGNLVGRVAALTDVDDRYRAEVAGERDRRELAERNDELRDLDESRMRYLATVSHELRTPLTSIVSFTELIRAESPGLGPDGGEYIDIIERNAERLLKLVGQMLDLDGLEQGVARLELEPISVPSAARESVRTGWSTATLDGISLKLSAQDGPDVQADGARLQQVLDNLISNAVKFSGSGGQVEVRATHDDREWRIDVADSGIGIPPSEVDRLFERFFRASNARQAKVPGTGLGLPTVKAITELHGGRIEVASAVGSGSTFTVYLPIGAVTGP